MKLRSELNYILNNFRKFHSISLVCYHSENAKMKAQINNYELRIIEPTLAYEKHRRRVHRNIRDFWEFFRNRTLGLMEDFPEVSERLMNIFNFTYDSKL